jgi:hypothetical protein
MVHFEGAERVGPGDLGHRCAVYERMPGAPSWGLRVGPDRAPQGFPVSAAPGSLALSGSLARAHEVGRKTSFEEFDRATQVFADMRQIVYIRRRIRAAEWVRDQRSAEG